MNAITPTEVADRARAPFKQLLRLKTSILNKRQHLCTSAGSCLLTKQIIIILRCNNTPQSRPRLTASPLSIPISAKILHLLPVLENRADLMSPSGLNVEPVCTPDGIMIHFLCCCVFSQTLPVPTACVCVCVL